MTDNTDDTVAEKALVVVSKNPANISFLVKSVGISLIILSVITSITVGIIAGGAGKKYILSKIEQCEK
jgi:hypothetical protein